MRFIVGLALSLTLAGILCVAMTARAQVAELEPDASTSVVRILAGGLSLREIGVDAAIDERLYSYASSGGGQSHVRIMDRGQLPDRPGDIALAIPKDQIKWVGLARRDWALGLLDGLSLDVDWRSHRGGERLVGLIDGGVQDGQLDVLSIDVSPSDADGITDTSGTTPAPQTATRTDPQAPSPVMTGLYGAGIWRLRPDIVLRQALARGVSQILIDLPMTADMSFPQFPIELQQLLQDASAADIAVWARPSVEQGIETHDLERLFAGIGAYNGLRRDAALAGIYLPYLSQKPDQDILSPDIHKDRFIETLTDLPRGDVGDLIVELPYKVWQTLDAGQKNRLEAVAQIGLLVSEGDAVSLMQEKVQHLPGTLLAVGATDSPQEAPENIGPENIREVERTGETEDISGADLPRYRLVFRSMRPKALARMSFARGHPGRLHIYFQGDHAVIILLAAPAPAQGGDSFILDYLQSPVMDAENYLGRETAMWTLAKRYVPTEFDFSQKNTIFIGSIILEMD